VNTIGFYFTGETDTNLLNDLMASVTQGKLQVPMDTIFPFTTEGVVQAYEKMASKKSLGKNVIQMVA